MISMSPQKPFFQCPRSPVPSVPSSDRPNQPSWRCRSFGGHRRKRKFAASSRKSAALCPREKFLCSRKNSSQRKTSTSLQYRLFDRPYVPEHVLVSVDGFDAEIRSAVGLVVE